MNTNSSHHFLRDMLKSPRYSYAQPTAVSNQVKPRVAAQNDQDAKVAAEVTAMDSHKENTTPTERGNIRTIFGGLLGKDRPAGTASGAQIDPNISSSKAQSSLASSTYQARGHLPQFYGAGKAHTSSLHHEHFSQPPSGAHVNLPSGNSYDSRRASFAPDAHEYVISESHTVPSIYHLPVSFGIDGAGDSTPVKHDSPGKLRQQVNPTYNSNGVTTAKNENKCHDVNVFQHYGGVNKVFEDPDAKKYVQLSSRRRTKTQSAV